MEKREREREREGEREKKRESERERASRWGREIWLLCLVCFPSAS